MSHSLKNYLIIGSLLIILSALTLFFFILPQYNNFQHNKNKLNDLQQKTAQNSSKIAALKASSTNPTYLDKVYKNVNNLWPDNLNVSEFIVQIEGLAKDSNLVIDSFSIEEQKNATSNTKSANQKNKPTGTAFTLSFKSGYGDFIGFLVKMENMARLNSINNLSINSDSENLTINITGSIFNGK